MFLAVVHLVFVVVFSPVVPERDESVGQDTFLECAPISSEVSSERFRSSSETA